MPLSFVVDKQQGRLRRRGARRAVRVTRGEVRRQPVPEASCRAVRCASTCSLSSPRSSTPTAQSSIVGQGPARRAGGSSRARSAGRRHRSAPQRATMPLSAAGPGMVLAPEPVFAAVELADPPRPLYLLAPGGRRFDQRSPPSWPASGADRALGRVLSRFSAAATRAWTSASPTISSTVSSRSATSCSPAANWPPSSSWRPPLGSSPACSATTASAEDESFTTGLLEYPQYTRPADLPGLGGPRGPARRRPRPSRAVATGGGAVAHPRAPTGPDRAPRRAFRPTRCASSLEHGYPLGAHGTGRADTAGRRVRRAASSRRPPSDRLEERDLS